MKIQEIILIIIFTILALNSTAQTIYTKSDTIQLEQDSVILTVNEYRGNIQWQYSKDSETWENIDGEFNDSLYINSIDSSCFYRAMITEDNCLPVFSDSTYVLRKLTEDEEQDLISQAGTINKDVAYYAPSDENTVITYIDTSGANNVVEIKTTADFDSLQIGWLLVDTTGLGQIIFVTDYKEEKSGANVIEKWIEGVQVGIDFLVTDQELSYSSPTNRTKEWWDNPMKLNNDGKIKKFGFESYLEGMEETVEEEYLNIDFSGTELWNIENDDSQLSITIEEGYLKYNPAIDFYSVYNPMTVATATLGTMAAPSTVLANSDYIVKGMLDKLKILTYNDFDFKLKLNIDASFDKSLDIKPKTIAHFWYNIPAGPIIISVKTELIARLTFEASGNINVQPEYELKKNLVLGLNVQEENGVFNKDYVFDHHEEKSSSTSYEGNFNFHERLEIVPSIEIYVYGIVGVDGELIPYQELDFNASFSDTHPPLFDCSLDIGVDGHASFDLSAFHFDAATAELFKGNWEMSQKKNLYHAPSKLSYYSGTGQTTAGNTTLPNPLKVKVLDSNNNPINNFPVFYEVTSGGGTVDNNVPKTNSIGVAGTKWTLGSQGDQMVTARLTKADINQIIGEVDFTANIDDSSVPSVTTQTASEITETTATLNGNVTSDGGATITQRGFYWSSTDQTPDSNDNPTTVSGTTGGFSKNLTNLTPNTTYYYAAYAKNSEGTKVGGMQSFKTSQESTAESGTFTDSRDGNIYKWVKIGEQVWMAENLAYLPSVNLLVSESDIEPLYYVYNYSGTGLDTAKDNSNYSVYGVLYNFPAAQDACPTGWHLPSKDEWKQLFQYVDEQKGPYEKDELNDWPGIGKHLKSKNGWIYNGNGTDDFGFNGLPGGMSWKNEFSDSEKRGYWWGATTNLPYYDNYVISVQLDFSHDNFNIFWDTKVPSKSVRCIKD